MTFVERFPYWIFMIIGVTMIGGASLQYLSATGALMKPSEVVERPEVAAGELVFFGQFDETQHIAENGDVHLLGQLDPFNARIIEDPKNGELAMHAFYPAEAKPDTKIVSAVIVAADNAGFLAWLSQNGSGNASMGDLYAIHGKVTRNRKYVSQAVNWISEQGKTTPEDFIVFMPYIAEAAAPNTLTRLERILPVTIMLLGGLCLFIGHRRREVQRIHARSELGNGVAILQGLPQ
jgi:hypothetical protein